MGLKSFVQEVNWSKKAQTNIIREDHCSSIIEEIFISFVPTCLNALCKITFQFRRLYKSLISIKYKIVLYPSVEKRNYKALILNISTCKSAVAR